MRGPNQFFERMLNQASPVSRLVWEDIIPFLMMAKTVVYYLYMLFSATFLAGFLQKYHVFPLLQEWHGQCSFKNSKI